MRELIKIYSMLTELCLKLVRKEGNDVPLFWERLWKEVIIDLTIFNM